MVNAIETVVDLPIHADPIRLAKRGVTLNGRIELSQFERLLPSLAQADSSCQLSLAFSLNERGLCLIEGSVRGCLQLVCQRCLGSFEWQFELPIQLAVVRAETEESKLPQGFEPVFSCETGLNVREAVEDELLLYLPNYPLHEEGLCR
jgi:uncharacterized protein